ALAGGAWMRELEVCPEGEELAEPPPLLHAAAAVSTSAAAPARQAVRIDISRNLTGIHLLVINRTLVGDKNRVDRPQICLGYSHPLGEAARSNKAGLPVRGAACIRPPQATSRACALPQSRLSGRLPASRAPPPARARPPAHGPSRGHARRPAGYTGRGRAEGGMWQPRGTPGTHEALGTMPNLPGRWPPIRHSGRCAGCCYC